jgi:hypothetical protein
MRLHKNSHRGSQRNGELGFFDIPANASGLKRSEMSAARWPKSDLTSTTAILVDAIPTQNSTAREQAGADAKRLIA